MKGGSLYVAWRSIMCVSSVSNRGTATVHTLRRGRRITVCRVQYIIILSLPGNYVLQLPDKNESSAQNRDAFFFDCGDLL